MSKHLEKLYKNKQPIFAHNFDHIVIFEYTSGINEHLITGFINPSTTEYEDFKRVRLYYTQRTEQPYFQRYNKKYYLRDFHRCTLKGGEN